MKIVNETELMANQKASTTIVPDKQFEALQTIEGNALLFSIGTDNILYCTREVPGDTHGWVRVDLSTALSASVYGGIAVVAKTFDIAQDLSSVNTVDIALVVTVNGQDHLHLATGFANTFANWTSATPAFTAYPFDDYAQPAYAGLPINEVQIVDGNGNQYIIADIITDATTQTISRYYIDTSKSLYSNPTTEQGCAWVPHNLSIDLQAGSITSFLGCGPNDGPNGAGHDIGGVYVLGTVANKAQLMYAPAFNFFNPEMQQHPTIFNLPSGTNAGYMAMGLSAPGETAPYTDLFFASNGSLYFLANADQVDTETTNATPQLIYTHSLFTNIQYMHVSNWNDNIVIWGQSLSPDGSGTSQLFIMEGVAGQETNANAWSCPIILLIDVVNSSAYVNNNYSLDSSINSENGNAYGSCNVLFAQQVINGVSSLTQLFQDPVTSAWQERSLLTAPTPENIMTEIYDTTTYSTHIEITDDSNITQPSLPVSIWSSSPCSVYITDAKNTAAYFTLDNINPTPLTADCTGNITIMQPVDTIGGISYYVTVKDPSTQQAYSATINPLSATLKNINAKLSTNDGLNASVTDEYGKSTQLVAGNIDSETKAAITANIQAVYNKQSYIPADGTVAGQAWPGNTPAVSATLAQIPKAQYFAKNFTFDPARHQIHGIKFGKTARFYDGIEAVREMGVVLNPDGSLQMTLPSGQLVSRSGVIEAKPGHLFKWMKSEADKLAATLDNMIQVLADGLVHCYFTIAEAVYHFVVKCMNDLVNIIHTVLSAIGTAFEDMVKWIGMIFSFEDIKNTHLVLKNIVNVFIDYVMANIGSLDGTIANLFQNIEDDISNKLGVQATDQTYAGNIAKATSPAGSKSPSANWGTHQLKSNANGSNTKVEPVTGDPIKDTLDLLLQKIQQEGDNFIEMGTAFQNLAPTAATIPITDLLAKILNIVTDFLLNTVEDLLTTAVDTVKVLLTDFDTALDKPVDIPVISYLYTKVTGDQLTPLDATCFIAAIPATVVYKAVRGKAPFPSSDPTTAQLINAADIPAMKAILLPPQMVGAIIGDDDYDVKPGSLLDRVTIAMNISALAGGAATSFMTAYQSLANIGYGQPLSSSVDKALTLLNSAAYFFFAGPDVLTLILTADKTKTDEWYNVMSNMCMLVGGAKALVDGTTVFWPGKLVEPSPADSYNTYIGPGLDLIIDVAWQVPTIALFAVQVGGRKVTAADANDIVGFIGGTFFDLAGILSPFLASASLIEDLPKREGAVAAVTGFMAYFNVLWGAACVVTSFDGLPA
jgi:hypothetical protein